MRSVIFVALLTVTASAAPAVAQDHIWSKRFGDNSNDLGAGIVADGAGNVVVAGFFRGTVDFGGGPLTSAGSFDIFVAKYDGAGMHVWSRRFGDSSDNRGAGVAVDRAGNIVMIGNFEGTVDFGGGPLTSAGSFDIFVAKYDGAGTHLWSQRFGGTAFDDILAIAVDGAGNVLVTGEFRGTVDFGGGPLTSGGLVDIFVAKYDTAGTHLWSQRYGSTSINRGYGIAVDGAGDVFVTGEFRGTVDFGGAPLISAGGWDIFVAKYDGVGTHLWSQRFGDFSNDGFRGGIATDGVGDVLVTGTFQRTVDFGGGPLTSAGSADIFVAKYDGAGKHVWSRRFGDTEFDDGRFIAVDGTGGLAVTGGFNHTVDFGGGPLTSAGLNDIFVAKYDGAGTHLWSRRFGDFGNDLGISVAATGAGDLLATGRFVGTVDFGGGPLTSAGEGDIFVAKFGEVSPVVAHLDIKPGSCPNPLNVTVPNGKKANGGVLPVAVLGSDGFDVYDIDVSSLKLEGAAPLRYSYNDVAGPPSGDDDCACSEIGSDGYTDLSLKFARLDVVDGLDHMSGQVRLTLTGRMKAGTEIEGSDCVQIVPRKGGGGPKLAPTSLGLAYPNPFNPTTVIGCELPSRGHATLTVYDVTGRLVATLVDGELPGGRHEVTWEARGVPSGVYFYRLQAGDFVQTRRMVLLK